MSAFRIEKLLIYPVRSLGGMAVPEARITPSGSFHGDREWVVVRPEGSLLWQGEVARMTLLSARLDADGLTLSGVDGQSGPRPADLAGGRTTITQDGYTLAGIDQGDAVADWLSGQLATACRLVRLGAEAHEWGGLNPLHALSSISLARLNERLAERGESPVEAERFRPNLILSGDHEAFEEEHATILHFEEASLTMSEPCVRCELPNISRKDASRSRQPLKMIGTMSRDRAAARPASFGMYCVAQGLALKVGMVARQSPDKMDCYGLRADGTRR